MIPPSRASVSFEKRWWPQDLHFFQAVLLVRALLLSSLILFFSAEFSKESSGSHVRSSCPSNFYHPTVKGPNSSLGPHCPRFPKIETACCSTQKCLSDGTLENLNLSEICPYSVSSTIYYMSTSSWHHHHRQKYPVQRSGSLLRISPPRPATNFDRYQVHSTGFSCLIQPVTKDFNLWHPHNIHNIGNVSRHLLHTCSQRPTHPWADPGYGQEGRIWQPGVI